jgi:serine/threonine protein kinase
MADSSVVSQVKALDTRDRLLADPRFGPKIRNVYPLTGKAGTTRKTVKTLGKGAFGRVNLEELNEGNVATKYFLNPADTLCENITEVATLRYLQGEPNVAQLIRFDPKPVSLNLAIPSEAKNLPFPAIVMGKAIGTLDDNNLFTSWDDLFSAIKQILLGYFTLHTRGIVHRDTKPQNMLKTSLGEIWITDFGMSRYTDTNHPTTKETYTGTYWYASPEILMKHELNMQQKNYFASDTWAMGASILHILRGREPFSGDTIHEVLDYIFAVKGTPDASDGTIFQLYEMYSILIHPFPNQYAKNPDAIKSRVELYTRFKPVDPAVLPQIAEIVSGLLEYDPAKRMTIAEALQRPIFGGSLPVVPPRMNLAPQYVGQRIQSRIPKIKNKYKLFEFLLNEAYKYTIDPESFPFVMDRAGVFIYSFFRIYTKHVFLSTKNLELITLVGFLIAYCLFDAGKYQKYTIEKIKLHGHTALSILKCIRLYVIADIQFYGRTLFDEIIQSLPAPTKTDIESYGYFNYTAFAFDVYNDTKETPESIKEKILTSALPRKTYFTDKESLPPLPVPGGGRRTKKQKRGKTRSSKKTQYNRHGRV